MTSLEANEGEWRYSLDFENARAKKRWLLRKREDALLFNVTRGLLNKTSEAHFKSCFAFHGNKHCVVVTGRDGF